MVEDMMEGMHDLGETPPEPSAVEDSPKRKREPYYPSVHIDAKQLPDLKGMDIGQKVLLMIEAEVVGIDANDWSGKVKHEYRLKLKKAMIHGASKKQSPKLDKAKKISAMFNMPQKDEKEEDSY